MAAEVKIEELMDIVSWIARLHYTRDEIFGHDRELSDFQHIFTRASLRIAPSMSPKVLLVMQGRMRCAAHAVLLQRHGFDVTYYSSGRDAYMKFLRHNYDKLDLVLVEWDMPDVGGRDLLHYAREDKATVPFLALLGTRCGVTPRQVLRIGADLYLRLPLFLHLNVLRRLLLPSFNISNHTSRQLLATKSNYAAMRELVNSTITQSPAAATTSVLALIKDVESDFTLVNDSDVKALCTFLHQKEDKAKKEKQRLAEEAAKKHNTSAVTAMFVHSLVGTQEQQQEEGPSLSSSPSSAVKSPATTTAAAGSPPSETLRIRKLTKALDKVLVAAELSRRRVGELQEEARVTKIKYNNLATRMGIPTATLFATTTPGDGGGEDSSGAMNSAGILSRSERFASPTDIECNNKNLAKHELDNLSKLELIQYVQSLQDGASELQMQHFYLSADFEELLDRTIKLEEAVEEVHPHADFTLLKRSSSVGGPAAAAAAAAAAAGRRSSVTALKEMEQQQQDVVMVVSGDTAPANVVAAQQKEAQQQQQQQKQHPALRHKSLQPKSGKLAGASQQQQQQQQSSPRQELFPLQPLSPSSLVQANSNKQQQQPIDSASTNSNSNTKQAQTTMATTTTPAAAAGSPAALHRFGKVVTAAMLRSQQQQHKQDSRRLNANNKQQGKSAACDREAMRRLRVCVHERLETALMLKEDTYFADKTQRDLRQTVYAPTMSPLPWTMLPTDHFLSDLYKQVVEVMRRVVTEVNLLSSKICYSAPHFHAKMREACGNLWRILVENNLRASFASVVPQREQKQQLSPGAPSPSPPSPSASLKRRDTVSSSGGGGGGNVKHHGNHHAKHQAEAAVPFSLTQMPIRKLIRISHSLKVYLQFIARELCCRNEVETQRRLFQRWVERVDPSFYSRRHSAPKLMRDKEGKKRRDDEEEARQRHRQQQQKENEKTHQEEQQQQLAIQRLQEEISALQQQRDESLLPRIAELEGKAKNLQSKVDVQVRQILRLDARLRKFQQTPQRQQQQQQQQEEDGTAAAAVELEGDEEQQHEDTNSGVMNNKKGPSPGASLNPPRPHYPPATPPHLTPTPGEQQQQQQQQQLQQMSKAPALEAHRIALPLLGNARKRGPTLPAKDNDKEQQSSKAAEHGKKLSPRPPPPPPQQQQQQDSAATPEATTTTTTVETTSIVTPFAKPEDAKGKRTTSRRASRRETPRKKTHNDDSSV